MSEQEKDPKNAEPQVETAEEQQAAQWYPASSAGQPPEHCAEVLLVRLPAEELALAAIGAIGGPGVS